MELKEGLLVLLKKSEEDEPSTCKIKTYLDGSKLVLLEKQDTGDQYWESTEHITPIQDATITEAQQARELVGRLLKSADDKEIVLVTGARFESKNKKKKQWYLYLGTGKYVALDLVYKHYRKI